MYLGKQHETDLSPASLSCQKSQNHGREKLFQFLLASNIDMKKIDFEIRMKDLNMRRYQPRNVLIGKSLEDISVFLYLSSQITYYDEA